MMMRYAQALKHRGARVIMSARKELIPLLSLCPYLDMIIPLEAPRPPYDFSTSMMSLPWIFNTDTETKIPQDPYLYADAQLVDIWRRNINTPAHTYNIGICWHTSGGRGRTVPVELIAQIASLENVTVYSLQKNVSAELNSLKNNPIIDLSKDLDTVHGAFMDTAALMKNLDLVIAIDTSVAHLAGALGVPVWLLLPYLADWRWLSNRDDSPWYPTMRIFRQTTPGDWESVIQNVKRKLQKIVGTTHAS